MLNVNAYPNVKTLHVGRGRALTVHDLENDVCWLLAYSPKHSKGARDDAYKYFEDLDTRGELMPTEGDAVKLESVSSAEFIDALTELGRELYEEARLSPRQEIGRSISFSTDEDADTALKASISIAIEFYVDDSGEAEECVVAFTVPPDEDFGVEQALDVMAALVPIDVAVNDISFANSIGTRNLNHAKNEIAFSWAKFS